MNLSRVLSLLSLFSLFESFESFESFASFESFESFEVLKGDDKRVKDRLNRKNHNTKLLLEIFPKSKSPRLQGFLRERKLL